MREFGSENRLPCGAGGEQQRAHRGGLADAHGRHRRADVLHRVVDRETRGHDPARRVDVERDVLRRVLQFEEQQLRANQARHRIVHRADQKDDPLLQQARIDVVGAFAAVGLLDHHRHQIVHVLFEIIGHCRSPSTAAPDGGAANSCGLVDAASRRRGSLVAPPRPVGGQQLLRGDLALGRLRQLDDEVDDLVLENRRPRLFSASGFCAVVVEDLPLVAGMAPRFLQQRLVQLFLADCVYCCCGRPRQAAAPSRTRRSAMRRNSLAGLLVVFRVARGRPVPCRRRLRARSPPAR